LARATAGRGGAAAGEPSGFRERPRAQVHRRARSARQGRARV